MQLQYLGTAAAEAFPAVFCHCDVCRRARQLGGKNLRARSGALINGKLLIDFPPDIFALSVKLGLDLGSINNLMVTHAHDDHFAVHELLLRDTAYSARFPEGETPLRVFGNAAVVSMLHAALQRAFGASERLSFAIHEVQPFQPFDVDDLRVIPLRALHNRREDCLIYIVEHDGKRLLYAHDTGYFPEEDWTYLAGMHFDLVSLDCCSGPDRDGNYHMGIPDNIEVKQRLEQLQCITAESRIIINHFSHNCGALYDELVAASEPYGFTVSYDGMTVTV